MWLELSHSHCADEYVRLTTQYYLLLTSYFLLPTSCLLSTTAYYYLLPAIYLSLITYHFLLSFLTIRFYCSLLTTHYSFSSVRYRYYVSLATYDPYFTSLVLILQTLSASASTPVRLYPRLCHSICARHYLGPHLNPHLLARSSLAHLAFATAPLHRCTAAPLLHYPQVHYSAAADCTTIHTALLLILHYCWYCTTLHCHAPAFRSVSTFDSKAVMCSCCSKVVTCCRCALVQLLQALRSSRYGHKIQSFLPATGVQSVCRITPTAHDLLPKYYLL